MNTHDILTAKRVLLVDDMSTIRKALTRMLDGFGMEVLPASDAGSVHTANIAFRGIGRWVTGGRSTDAA